MSGVWFCLIKTVSAVLGKFVSSVHAVAVSVRFRGGIMFSKVLLSVVEVGNLRTLE